jgi:hypothetical protein
MLSSNCWLLLIAPNKQTQAAEMCVGGSCRAIARELVDVFIHFLQTPGPTFANGMRRSPMLVTSGSGNKNILLNSFTQSIVNGHWCVFCEVGTKLHMCENQQIHQLLIQFINYIW